MFRVRARRRRRVRDYTTDGTKSQAFYKNIFIKN